MKPTAQALVAEVASTSRSSPPPGGSGLAEMLHLVPFHRSITGRLIGRVPVSARPTAQALVAESASTPQRTLWNWVRLGLGTGAQVAAEAGEATENSSGSRARSTFLPGGCGVDVRCSGDDPHGLLLESQHSLYR